MLPGFRFLFAAILLSASVLVFGLGAAALLRTTHQQYVSNSSWRNGPQEQVFAQAPAEPAQPVLAVLRAEPETAAEPTPSLRDQVPTIGLPATEPQQVAAVAREAEAQPEVTIAAPPSAEPAKAEIKPEAMVIAAASAPGDTLTPADTTVSIATAAPPPVSATEVPRTATPALASRVPDLALARTAALNDLTPAKPKADSSAAKPRASKPKKRKRIVRRPPPQQSQQQLDPFGQQQQTLAATTARARQ